MSFRHLSAASMAFLAVWLVASRLFWQKVALDGLTTVAAATAPPRRIRPPPRPAVSATPEPAPAPSDAATACTHVCPDCTTSPRETAALGEALPPVSEVRRNLDQLDAAALRYQSCFSGVKAKQRAAKGPMGSEARRKFWIDLGSRQLDVTGNFERLYPKARQFSKHAFEPDPAFASVYAGRPQVHYHPYAVSTRNETLVLSSQDVGSSIVASSKEAKRHGVPVRTINWAEWLRQTVTERDFVVVKMDVESAEFGVLNHLVQSGAITLIDELLLECHYRSRRSRVLVTTDPSDEAPVTRNECKSLVHSLELLGIVAVNWSKKNYWADVYAKAHGGFQAS